MHSLMIGNKKLPLAAILNGCGFIGIFLFILLYVDPPVVYTSNGFDLHRWVHACRNVGHSPKMAPYPANGTRPVYNLELTGPFFHKAFTRPGGFDFVATCAAIAACHLPVLGSAVLVMIALLIFWAFPLYVRNSRGPPLLITRWLPALFLVVACCRYDLSWLSYFIAIAGVVLLAVVYQKLSRGPRSAALIFLALFWLSYYLFQWAALLFLVFVLIHELCIRPRQIAPLAIAGAIALALFWLIESRFISLDDDACTWNAFMAWPVPPLAVAGYFPLIALCVRVRPLPVIQKRMGAPLIRASLLLVIAAATLYGAIEDQTLRETRIVARSMHQVLNRDWDALLAEDASLLYRDKSAMFLKMLRENMVDHALYEKQRLGDDLFTCPQVLDFAEPLLLLHSSGIAGFANWGAALDLYMEIGAANLAERVAGELMENMGPYPFILERRALIQAAKGNNKAAAVYLRRLSGMPFWHHEAESLLVRMSNGAIAQDERVARLASCKDTIDYLFYHAPEDAMLANLLAANPQNRMAWEYLITYYLKMRQPARILGEVGRYREFGYTSIPAIWGQAICICLKENPSLYPGIASIMPQRECVMTCERFFQACASYRDSQPSAAIAALKSSFGNTYFFPYLFRSAPGSAQ